MRPIAIGPCRSLDHDGHEVLISAHPVGPHDHPRGLLTIWSCPIEGWGGFWHDLARDPTHDGIGGGPDLDALPPRR